VDPDLSHEPKSVNKYIKVVWTQNEGLPNAKEKYSNISFIFFSYYVQKLRPQSGGEQGPGWAACRCFEVWAQRNVKVK
jgi:hypothetical protein